jgi:hypothetical protein
MLPPKFVVVGRTNNKLWPHGVSTTKGHIYYTQIVVLLNECSKWASIRFNYQQLWSTCLRDKQLRCENEAKVILPHYLICVLKAKITTFCINVSISLELGAVSENVSNTIHVWTWKGCRKKTTLDHAIIQGTHGVTPTCHSRPKLLLVVLRNINKWLSNW